MKKKIISLMLSVFLIINMTGFSVFADGETEEEPAAAKLTYEFDDITYVNNGEGKFSKNQMDYYKSMLHNSLDKNGASVSNTVYDTFDSVDLFYEKVKVDDMSVADMWTFLGMKMLCTTDRSDDLGDNLFRKEEEYFSNKANWKEWNLLRVYLNHDNSESGNIIRELSMKSDFKSKGSSTWVSDDIDFKLYRESMRSAASIEALEKNVARTAASEMVDWDGNPVTTSDPLTCKVINEPELSGPVFYTFIGASGADLHNLQGKYAEKNIHGLLVCFSDFSITPIIPDENVEAPYAYVKTSGGTSSKNEKKVVSDVKNYSGEAMNASQTISENVSSTVTSSINGSKGSTSSNSYDVSTSIKVGAKFSLSKVFEASEEMTTTVSAGHSTSETVSKGWSTSEGTQVSETESRTVSINLPPYTTALMSQELFNSEEQVRYNCPTALNYKVTIYYVSGKLNDKYDSVEISFDKLTDFGASGDARTDLAKRYAQSTGSSHMTDADGIDWSDVVKDEYGNSVYADMLSTLTHTATFDSTSATFSAKVNLVRTEVEDILPIYPIDSIKFVNPDNVLYTKPWLTEINIEKGDTDYVTNYRPKALNEFGAEFYTFYALNGSYIFLDENGNDITEGGNSVVKTFKDPVTGQLKFTATGEGTVYLRYKINNGIYRTASMAATDTPEDYIDDNEIPHPAILQINVSDTGHEHTWLKPKYVWSDDYSTCTAYAKCKFDDTHMKQETSDAVKTVVSEPTETKEGVTTYTASFETEGFEAQTTTVKTPPTGKADNKDETDGKSGDKNNTDGKTDNKGENNVKNDWKQVEDVWYFFDSDGNKATGWKEIGGKWYFFNSNGAMATGWIKTDGKWYYLCQDGSMDYSEYREGYWLNADGSWDEAYSGGHWIGSNSAGWWYQDNTGYYPKSTDLWIDGTKYHFDGKGWCTNP